MIRTPSEAWPIERVGAEDALAMGGLLRIYRQAIEPSEQKPAGEIASLVRDPRYALLVARSGDVVAGFAIAFFPDDDFWLLEYMAVDPVLRSRGLGRALLLAARKTAEAAKPGAPCVLEVDRPGSRLAPGNDADRRLRFYQGVGCRRIDGLDYILPLDREGTPPPMWLLVHDSDTTMTIARSTLARWLCTIYRSVYGQRADDPRIDRMIALLPTEIRLVRPQ